MPLRAKKPDAVTKRLKLFLYGPAGVGKTTAMCQLPKPYIIDGERGSENYEKLINSVGGEVYQTTDMEDVIHEVKCLLTEKHDFKTLVIDPMTPIYNDLLAKCEAKVGDSHGKHYGAASKEMKRLVNLLMALDMNVCVTSHAKREYGANFAVLGQTFDCWKSFDYVVDLVIELEKEKKTKKRMAIVRKTRLEAFPDEDRFEWSYDALRARCGEVLDREAGQVPLASPEQVREVKDLLAVVKLPEGTTEKWFIKASVEDGCWEDMPTSVITKIIEFIKNRLPAAVAASAA